MHAINDRDAAGAELMLAKLVAEMEQLRVDANRYRWLREHGDTGCTEKDGYGGQTLRLGDDLDNSVDAMMR